MDIAVTQIASINTDTIRTLTEKCAALIESGDLSEFCSLRRNDQSHYIFVTESESGNIHLNKLLHSLAHVPGVVYGRQAVLQILGVMLGKNSQEVASRLVAQDCQNQISEQMSEAFAGAVCQRLAEIGLELLNRLSAETDIGTGAVTPEGLSENLARRILEDIKNITVTILGSGSIFESFIHFWTIQGVEKVNIVESSDREAVNHSLSDRQIQYSWQDRGEAVAHSDVIILASGSGNSAITAEMVKKNLQNRKKRHLFIYNWTDTVILDRDIVRMSSVFVYPKEDLTGMLEITRSERRVILEENDRFLQESVDSFLQWAESEARYTFHGIVGKSRKMQQVFQLIRRVADADITVLVNGDTGTGKEMVARAIHAVSPRNEGPFIPVNCGAIPETLLESELFGHTRGAFTGADADRTGLLQEATGGTVFLDEIGDTTQMFQVKLLRALQEREIMPLGSSKRIPIDVRIIAATSKNLEKEIERGNFRSDLYYRINVVKIALPKLRDRKSDILLLARYFIRKYNKRMGKKVHNISSEVADLLLRYPWKGNVRELENVIERAVALCLGYEIQPVDLPDHFQNTPPTETTSTHDGEIKTLEQVEQEYITKLLQEFQGNYAEVANKLGIGRTTLWRKMKKYGLEREE